MLPRLDAYYTVGIWNGTAIEPIIQRDTLEPIPKHVIFVLDTSDSMTGTKLGDAKDAAKVDFIIRKLCSIESIGILGMRLGWQ